MNIILITIQLLLVLYFSHDSALSDVQHVIFICVVLSKECEPLAYINWMVIFYFNRSFI